MTRSTPATGPDDAASQEAEAERYVEFVGTTATVEFESGDRVVATAWHTSPVGAFVEVLWAEADGWRTLFTPDEAAKALVAPAFEADSLIIAPAIRAHLDDRTGLFTLGWANAQIELQAGEEHGTNPLRALLDRGGGESADERFSATTTGVWTWEQFENRRPIENGWCVVAGRDLGAVVRNVRDPGFGLEVASQPEVVDVIRRFHDPAGRVRA